MVTLKGYRINDKIYDGNKTLVYRGIKKSNQKPIVVKLSKSEYPTFSELVKFRNQYIIAKNLNLPGVISFISLEKYRNGFALIMEDFGGISLKEYANSRNLSLEEILNITIAIAKSLEGLYSHRIVHKDIKPYNILINPQTKQVKLIDFSISSLLPKENQEIQNPHVLEGTLNYISPEQTGRMNRGIDYRTDFYSLGVTLYELLTNRLPFQSNDPMELVYCHLAKQPTPPIEVNPTIPQMVNDIIMKLMNKTPEQRYQTAFGIRSDLEKCLERWQTNGQIAPFLLGQRDISDHFFIPEKLYGRETEVFTLLAAFDRISQGTTEMMLVAGFSGIGKTAVVNEVHKPIVRQRGYFISGKFDRFKKNTPFSALVQAFQNLMRQLLTESNSSLAEWKTKILSALGENGQVIIDVIPELETIIGKQPEVPELPPTSAQNRFNILFEKFIQVFATKEHPLIIFLDDLQWADSASLKLIKLLMTGAKIGYFLLLGAYRDCEVNPSHPLILTLNEIRSNHATINQITLAPLNVSDLNRLIADTLNCPSERSLPLTELVHQKTNGNPFFTNQFLKFLHQDGIISFDFNSRSWQCDIARVKSLAASNDVVEFMAAQLQKLPEKTQEVLKLAACIGNQFDLDKLAIVSEKSQAETATDLWLGLQEGLVLPQNEIYKFFQDEQSFSSQSAITNELKKITISYKFLHDRVQQAAYFLIPEEQKKSIHLKIGRLLLRNIPLESREENIFEIVNQLNTSISLIIHQDERDELAQLNLIAGKKALAATAYAAAVKYLNTGIELLAPDSWNNQYHLTLALYEKAAEAAYLSTDFAQMEQLADIALDRAKSLLDKIKTYEIKIQAYTVQNQLLKAVQTALSVVKLLGINFPKKTSNLKILLGMLGTKLTLARKSPADFINLPRMSEPLHLARMQILLSVHSAAYISAPQLYPLIIFKQLKLSVKYGNTSGSVVVYATYGLILCGIVGDIETGYKFGQLALNLLERLNAKEVKTKTLFHVYNFIFHWKDHAKEGVTPLLDAYCNGLETGDLDFSAYSIHQYCFRLYAIGKELTELAKEMATYNDAIVKLKQETALNYNKIYHQAVLNLIGNSENPCILNGEVYDEQRMLPIHLSANDQIAAYNLYFNKLILCYLFADYVQAIESAEKAEKNLEAVVGSPFVPLFYFYDSLSRLGLYLNRTKLEQKQLLAKVQANQKKMRKWAKFAPMNYLHKFYLVEAERYRIFGQNLKAMDCYKRAIAESQKHEYVNEEALAQELAAKFYLAWGFQPIAQTYLINAYYAYARWGAKAKLKDLEKRYPQLLTPIVNRETNLDTRETLFETIKGTVTSSSNNSSVVFDLATVMKASQAISGEIVFEQLLKQVMKAAIENAGAQKGFLILEKNENWVIEAAMESEEITILQSIPVDSLEPATNIPRLSTAIVNYVARSHENVVLNNATDEGQFTRDAYIIATQPKSILCISLLNQGKLAGILYLENNLAIGAFTPERVETLKIIAAQAAISIKNAYLYEQLEDYNRTLEQKVAERTQELLHTVEILKATQSELVIENSLLRSAEEPSSYNYQVGGSLPLDAPTYVVRSADRHLYKALRLGQLCYILNTRQMGKSSLCVQILKKMQAEGFACTAIDISVISSPETSLEQWYAGFTYLLVSGLKLSNKVKFRGWWREHEFLSPAQRLSEFINEVLLRVIEEKIIIFIDEIDGVLDLQFDSSAFFSIIRTCYNKRADSSDYQRLNFVLLGVATPSQLIQDKNGTPFNVGQAIQLKGFQVHEAQPLLQGLTKRVSNPQTLLKEVIAWTGGQPFLTQKVCKLICSADSAIPTNEEATYVEELVRSQIIENWESQDQPEHLRTIRDRLLRDKQRARELLKLYQQILHQGQVMAVNSPEETELLICGLVVKREGYLQVNNRIYQMVFDEPWVLKHLD